ncbi:hypothetical protein ABZS66_48630 [Dactylosporangium sp. NPDC005572]|uniref:hypothetical protein n=1 Tax=Dactylosporangium sp. NPDC005572 TaxID=3156889 RepID=UPI0033B85EB1
MNTISRRGMLRAVGAAAAGVALASGSVATASAAPAAVTATTTCAMQTLPVPADTYRSDAAAIDPTGRFIVGSAIVRRDTDTYPLLLWDRGQLTTFDAPVPGGTPVDVNRKGVVIGNGSTGLLSTPWRYRHGVGALLPVIDPADQTTVVAINTRGDIAGVGLTPAGHRYGMMWPADEPGTVRVINTPSANSVLTGLTDDGTIVGSSGLLEPTSWLRTPHGVLRPLTGPDGAGGTSVWAAAGHWAVGQGYQAGTLVGLRWDLRTRRPTVLDPRLDSSPTDVNAQGVVLAGNLLQRGNTVVTLPSPSPDHIIGGRAIADNATVIGFHNPRLAGGVRAVRWIGC